MSLREIETARLRMRPCTPDDVDELHRLWTDPGVRKYLWDDAVIPRETAEEVVNVSMETFSTRGFGFWVVMLREEQAIIGFCGFRLFDDPPEVEILYGIYPEYWGQGLATEAAKAMIRCGFEEHGFARIWAGADPPNAASFRVMKRSGMKYAKQIRVGELDAIYYEIRRQDFQPDDSVYILRKD
ncbi:MAG TPA: GNAT family N-acetyltransferase [Blastocatellia bacterium]|nr:GNAT family N-acetyltransferase [Blastocatellia bacterium]